MQSAVAVIFYYTPEIDSRQRLEWGAVLGSGSEMEDGKEGGSEVGERVRWG